MSKLAFLCLLLCSSLFSAEQDARAQSRPFRDELAELSNTGDAKQSHLNREESPSFKEGVLQKTRQKLLKEKTEETLENSKKIASFYELQPHDKLKEITEQIVSSPLTSNAIKALILKTGRRFFLFQYPSDGLRVKGYLSYVPSPAGRPLMVLLRGGAEIFGLMHPANIYSCIDDFTVLATAYRGGVSEGKDEYGGSDVNDVLHLIQHLPELEKQLGLKLDPPQRYLLGASRGGMEMFLTLARFPELQTYFSKAVSLSGLLDIEQQLREREDLKAMFIDKFGLVPGENEKQWISRRSAIETIGKIRKDLPILILQGTQDIRVSLELGSRMVDKLKENGSHVDYVEITGGNHCLKNQSFTCDIITAWLRNTKQ